MILQELSTYKYLKIVSRSFFVILFCALPLLAEAQMFSVDNSTSDRSIPGIAIYAGIGPMSFDYEGNNVNATEPDLFAFDGSVLHLRAEGRGLTLFLGAGGSTTGLDDHSYFNAGIKYGYGLPLLRTSAFGINLPIQLRSSITRVSNDQVVTSNLSEFDQGSLALGGGLNMYAAPANRFRISAGVVPSYGFSFSTRQRDAEGSVFGVEGKTRLYFDQLFGSAGLSLGYTYDFREYDINGNNQLLDYKATGHSFLIGVTF